jgi:hypothetical protein
MTTTKLSSLTIAILASCAAAQHGAYAGDTAGSAAPAKPRCGPGGPPGAKCGPPAAPQPTPLAPPAELVHPSVITVVSTVIDGESVRAVSGRGKQGAFVTLETIKDDRVTSRTAIAFDVVADSSQLDVIQLMWRTDRPGDLVFHLGEKIGGWICHLERGTSTAKCVIARGGGRPSK